MSYMFFNVGHGSNLVGPMTPSLSGKTLVISGGSRGIGLAIALRAARDGANITLLAKTAEPHPRLPGTIYTAAETIEAAGGRALPIVGDVRNDDAIAEAVQQTVDRFGGIDVCVNNASAIDLRMTDALDMKRYDLMQDINCRGTFALSKACTASSTASESTARPGALRPTRPLPRAAARRAMASAVTRDSQGTGG
jgi:citronellol/citronellal dehydrogenase